MNDTKKSSIGKASRNKGARGERNYQKYLQQQRDLHGDRIPSFEISERNLLQAMSRHSDRQDLSITLNNGLKIPIEVKNVNMASANYQKFINVLQKSIKSLPPDIPFAILAVHVTGGKNYAMWYQTVVFKNKIGVTFLANQFAEMLNYGLTNAESEESNHA